MKQMVLKVDVDTYTGTLQGVPSLLELFDQFQVKATFLFSLGPDHTGRAIRRVFRKGFLQKVGRTSVVSNYGIKTLLYGVLLPGPHIGRRAGHVMRQAQEAGHEVGIHCYDHVLWQDFVAGKDLDWTREQMQKARDAFEEVFGFAPKTHGAAGWQLNPQVLSLEQEMGFSYASDVRGTEPFYPEMEGVISQCMQLPTTLPTLDEIIGRDQITEANAHEKIIELSTESLPHGHVYTLHAELEGMKLKPIMRDLLDHWVESEFNFLTLEKLYSTLDIESVARRSVAWGELEGRSGQLAMQGERS
jgi:undecaprenyl phosphate-alpha-L-ara4FN deformylase